MRRVTTALFLTVLVLATVPAAAEMQVHERNLELRQDFRLAMLRFTDSATKPVYELGDKPCDGAGFSNSLRHRRVQQWIRVRIHRGEKFSFHVAPMLRFSLKWFRHNKLTPQKAVILNLGFSWTRN